MQFAVQQVILSALRRFDDCANLGYNLLDLDDQGYVLCRLVPSHPGERPLKLAEKALALRVEILMRLRSVGQYRHENSPTTNSNIRESPAKDPHGLSRSTKLLKFLTRRFV